MHLLLIAIVADTKSTGTSSGTNSLRIASPQLLHGDEESGGFRPLPCPSKKSGSAHQTILLDSLEIRFLIPIHPVEFFATV